MGFLLMPCLAVFWDAVQGAKIAWCAVLCCVVLLCIGEVCLMLMHNSFACGLVCICQAHVASWSGTCAVWYPFFYNFFFTMFCCDSVLL